MKVFLAIVALCVASALGALTDEQIAKLRHHKEACIAETGVDLAVLTNLKNGQVPANDEKLSCFGNCLLRRIGVLNDQGHVNEEISRHKLGSGIAQDKADEIVNRCKVLTGSNDCDAGWQKFKCFLDSKALNIL